MRKLTLAFVAVAALFGSAALEAQTAAVGDASITIPPLLSISVDQLTVTFAQPNFGHYDAGSIQSAVTSTIDTRANVVHDVTIAADAAAMTYTGTLADPGKPSTDLQWSADGGSSWTGLTPAAVDVVTAEPRGSRPGMATVIYQMLLDEANDVPGDYELGFTYTVVAN